MKRELVTTRDGSHSLFVPELNERYHSVHGALSESKHVFVDMGLREIADTLPEGETLRILEIGFGTGLNALLTLRSATQPVWYTAVEAFPVTMEEAKQLNYPDLVGGGDAVTQFEGLHAAAWDRWEKLAPNFQLYKMQAQIEDFVLAERVHVVYFDAFAPEKQPELWTAKIFARMHAMLLPGGLLTTYCAKGEVRRTMQRVGFEVFRIQGPPGKREMLRARRPVDPAVSDAAK